MFEQIIKVKYSALSANDIKQVISYCQRP